MFICKKFYSILFYFCNNIIKIQKNYNKILNLFIFYNNTFYYNK